MTDSSSQAEAPTGLYRIASLREFLRLSAEDGSLVSTRGQRLPGIIQSRSSANLSGLRNRTLRNNSVSTAELPRRHSHASSLSGPLDTSKPVLQSPVAGWGGGDDSSRRMSYAANILLTPQVRSQRLIGNNNPRYQWEQYWKSDEQLKEIKNKKVRKYYERNNYLIQHYMYIDRLLDSSLPHDLIQDYQQPLKPNGNVRGYGTAQTELPETISEEDIQIDRPRLYTERHGSFDSILANGAFYADGGGLPPKVKRTPRDIFRVKDDDSEREPLLNETNSLVDLEVGPMPPALEIEEEASSQSPIVTVAIIINLVANTALLVMKIVVVVLSSSISVLASLVDAALDFLSTAIVGITTRIISRSDQYAYPIGRRRLEPVGVLVFSVIMITAFLQVFYQAFIGMTNGNHEIVELTIPAIAIMASTVVIKFACWLWCRLIKNSSVQALAQDAMTDVVFNTFSIIFPLGELPSHICC